MTAQGFRPLADFEPSGSDYRLLPFRFMRWTADEYLLVNEAGEYLFLDGSGLADLVRHRLSRSHPTFSELKTRHFITDTTSTLPLALLATKYRTKKSFLEGFIQLHLFVVTLRCDHSCRYCQVSRVSSDRARFDMSEETARRAVALMFQCPAPRLKVEFQGGEPLLHFELIRFIIEEVERRNAQEGRDLEFVVTSNLVPLTLEILDYLQAHRVLLSTSLDGPAFLHNANRPRPGKDSHELLVRHLELARAVLGQDRIAAIMTTTSRSLQHPRAIIDEYLRLGFDAIFLRPISPYGFAVHTGEALRYDTEQFLTFYREALAYIIELNRQGKDFVEVYAQILLTKILTPFATGYVDLQSPVGVGAVAYNYDGDVYVSDEARMLAAMGDPSFRLGNVHHHSYAEIFGGETLRAMVAASVLETLPGCTDCAFLPYCGADPLFHYRTQGDVVGHRPTSAFCAKNMGILRHLFALLRSNDLFCRELLLSWATRVCLPPGAEVSR